MKSEFYEESITLCFDSGGTVTVLGRPEKLNFGQYFVRFSKANWVIWDQPLVGGNPGEKHTTKKERSATGMLVYAS